MKGFFLRHIVPELLHFCFVKVHFYFFIMLVDTIDVIDPFAHRVQFIDFIRDLLILLRGLSRTKLLEHVLFPDSHVEV